jgi:signal transduction histidine kinase
LNKRLSYLLLFFLLASSVLGQRAEREQLVTAYVYALAKNIQWPEDIENFKIHVISQDEKLREEFIKLVSSRKINGLPMSLDFTDSYNKSIGTQIIYLDPNYSDRLMMIFDRIRGEPILLISDNYEDERFIMINFQKAEGRTLGFEINQANIINQGLEILPDMVLLGGTQVDVAALYRASQDSMRTLESQIQNLQDSYRFLEKQIENSRELIRQQRDQLSEQSEEIENKQNVISQQQSALDNLLNEVNRSEQELARIATKLENREETLYRLQSDIRDQSAQISEGNKILEQQKKMINEQNEQIDKRESQLEEMSGTVSDQKQALTLLIGFSLLILAFVILLFVAYRARRRDARKLSDQKARLTTLLNELNDAQSQLVHSEKMASLGVLTSGIAHEINNAINFVYSGIQIIENKFDELQPLLDQLNELDPDQKLSKKTLKELVDNKEKLEFSESSGIIQQMIKNVLIGAERTAEIVKGLRTFSRTGDDAITQIDIHQELDIAMLLLKGKNRERARMVTQLNATKKVINGYQGQLGQAFLNLISNAYDAIEEKGENGEIKVITSNTDEHIEIEISDDGIGMDKSVQEKVFDPFYTTKEVGKGTGLGLSITYGIIEKHQGHIELSSEKGVGTNFRIVLPLDGIKENT